MLGGAGGSKAQPTLRPKGVSAKRLAGVKDSSHPRFRATHPGMFDKKKKILLSNLVVAGVTAAVVQKSDRMH